MTEDGTWVTPVELVPDALAMTTEVTAALLLDTVATTGIIALVAVAEPLDVALTKSSFTLMCD